MLKLARGLSTCSPFYEGATKKVGPIISHSHPVSYHLSNDVEKFKLMAHGPRKS